MARSLIALAVFLLVWTERTMACDACGCSVNSAGVGLTAVYRKNFAGLQYQYVPFSSTLEHAIGATDHFHSFELTARMRVLRRINLQLNIPYRLNVRNHPDGDDMRSGLGDARFAAHYVLADQKKLKGDFRLFAEAGLGLKTPTGHFDPALRDEHNLPENFNPGNGSWAWLAQANVVLSRNNGGITLSGSYLLNSPSSSGYRFGPQWSGQVFVFNQFLSDKKISLTPHLGLAAEGIGRDINGDGKYAPSTGGQGWYLAGGLNFVSGKWLLGAVVTQPFIQTYSNEEVKAKTRFTIHFIHFFNN
jgi:hypothetical protein